MLSAFRIAFWRQGNAQDRELRLYLRKHWGVRPSGLSCYAQALRHKSMVGSGKFCHQECNERLELLGDSILDSIITEHLFTRFPNATEGELTKMRSRIVSRNNLSRVGMAAGLHEHLQSRISSSDSSDTVVGNAVEALIGAIYLDRGYKMARKAVLNHLVKRYMDFETVVHISSDFKSRLIEWSQRQRRHLAFATHEEADTKGSFMCQILLDGQVAGTAADKSKKRAEQLAARQLCESLELIET